MINPGTTLDLDRTEKLISAAVEAARGELDRRRADHDAIIDQRLAQPAERLARWVDRRHDLSFGASTQTKRRDEDRYTSAVRTDTTKLIEDLRTKGQPLVRVLAVLMPGGTQ